MTNQNQVPNQEDPPESYAQQRIAICRQCPEYKLMICGQCGCFMPAKTRLRGAVCPLGKWTQAT